MSVMSFARSFLGFNKPALPEVRPSTFSTPITVTTKTPLAPSLMRVEVEIKIYKDSREQYKAHRSLSCISTCTAPTATAAATAATAAAAAAARGVAAPAPECPIGISRCAPVAPALTPANVEAEFISDSGPDVQLRLFCIRPSFFACDIYYPRWPVPTSPSSESLPQGQEYDLELDILELYCNYNQDHAHVNDLDDQLLEQRESSLYSYQESDTHSDYNNSLFDIESISSSCCSSPKPFSSKPEGRVAWTSLNGSILDIKTKGFLTDKARI
ncbi:hypothetical protein BG004_004153 [Podila humilis]|nr:hypothetical protein BG004_004153 [Podila humilis]